MDEINQNNMYQDINKKKKRIRPRHLFFMQGIVFGILFTLCTLVCVKQGIYIYKYGIKGELNYEAKTKLIYDTLEENYVGEINKEDMFEGMYLGMVLNTTDRYSTYIPASAYGDFKQSISGEYVGIGVVVNINENNNVEIKYVFEGSTSEEAGILPGDIIVSVDEVEATAENYEDIVELVKGVEGTVVKLKLYRPEQALTMTKEVERAKVDTPTVSCTMLEDKIGYIRISEFDGVTYDQFKAGLDDLTSQGMEKLIVDLRDNPGGLLTSVSDVLDEFLDEGVITYTENKAGEREYEYSSEGSLDIPVAVMVNGGSASAAELFTAAMQDRADADVIGENTYGKGVVQTTIPFSDGSALKLTTSRYYTPNGVCIDGVGVKPDYEISAYPDFEMPYLDNSKAEFAENDIQLEKALEVIKNK